MTAYRITCYCAEVANPEPEDCCTMHIHPPTWQAMVDIADFLETNIRQHIPAYGCTVVGFNIQEYVPNIGWVLANHILESTTQQ